jgi:hypothetical protein
MPPAQLIDANKQCYRVNNTLIYGIHREDYTTPGGILYRKIRVKDGVTHHEPYIKAVDLTPVESARCAHIDRTIPLLILHQYNVPVNNGNIVGGLIKRKHRKTRKTRKHRKSRKRRHM